jgi:hypothetical protein
VLDDVLVNCDAVRAKAAVKVLCDFANDGHQLLVFTCHEHLLKIFENFHADVRRLPLRAELQDEDEVSVPMPVFQSEPVAEEAAEEEPAASVLSNLFPEPEPEPPAAEDEIDELLDAPALEEPVYEEPAEPVYEYVPAPANLHGEDGWYEEAPDESHVREPFAELLQHAGRKSSGLSLYERTWEAAD